MAESHIDDATIGKMTEVLQVPLDGQSILNAEHDALASFMLVHPEIIRRTGDANILLILGNNLLYLIKDEIGIVLGTSHVEINNRGKGLVCLWLWQISHHDSSILTSFRHFLQINEDLRVTLVKVNPLREEHRGVAMGVEREHPIMHTVGLTVGTRLTHEPLEEGLPRFKTLRMPLHTQHRFILTALHRLNDAVRRTSYDTEPWTWLRNGLMMERVYHQLLLLIYIK